MLTILESIRVLLGFFFVFFVLIRSLDHPKKIGVGEGRGESELEMARAQKAKRVSWPPDVNLCQVVTQFLVHVVLGRSVASLI